MPLSTHRTALPALLLCALLNACSATSTSAKSEASAQPTNEATTPEFVPGELLIRVEDPAILTTDALARAAGRDDLSVASVECVLKSCRVVFHRSGGAADPEWTQAVKGALTAAALPGVLSVELNTIAHPR